MIEIILIHAEDGGLKTHMGPLAVKPVQQREEGRLYAGVRGSRDGLVQFVLELSDEEAEAQRTDWNASETASLRDRLRLDLRAEADRRIAAAVPSWNLEEVAKQWPSLRDPNDATKPRADLPDDVKLALRIGRYALGRALPTLSPDIAQPLDRGQLDKIDPAAERPFQIVDVTDSGWPT